MLCGIGHDGAMTDQDHNAIPGFVRPEELRAFHRDNRKPMGDKRCTAREAVERLVKDDDYLGIGGFGTNRIPTAILHEIVRQRRKGLSFAGHTATHDCQLLVAGECIDHCDVAYVVGLEARGLSAHARRAFESGRITVTDWSNGALAWRLRAAAMGVSFLPARTMLGTDTFERSAATTIQCPFTGQTHAALPALSPDVSAIHVHRCDPLGNAQIDGILIADPDLARASKRVILTCEEVVETDRIRAEPWRTVIPGTCVDAVVEAPYGSYPGNMPGLYYSDEPYLANWLEIEKGEAAFARFIREQVYDCADHAAYIRLNGGEKRMRELADIEHNP